MNNERNILLVMRFELDDKNRNCKYDSDSKFIDNPEISEYLSIIQTSTGYWLAGNYSGCLITKRLTLEKLVDTLSLPYFTGETKLEKEIRDEKEWYGYNPKASKKINISEFDWDE